MSHPLLRDLCIILGPCLALFPRMPASPLCSDEDLDYLLMPHRPLWRHILLFYFVTTILLSLSFFLQNQRCKKELILPQCLSRCLLWDFFVSFFFCFNLSENSRRVLIFNILLESTHFNFCFSFEDDWQIEYWVILTVFLHFLRLLCHAQLFDFHLCFRKKMLSPPQMLSFYALRRHITYTCEIKRNSILLKCKVEIF